MSDSRINFVSDSSINFILLNNFIFEFMIKYKGEFYDALISDGDIVLQSLQKDVIFSGAAKILEEDATKEWYSVEYAGSTLKAFISQYIDDTLQSWIKIHEDEGVVIINNNLN